MTGCILPNGITGTICLKWLNEMNRTVKQTWLPWYHTQIYVSHLPGCHRMSHGHEQFRLITTRVLPLDAWNCNVHITLCTSRCGDILRLCLIQRHVGMSSSSLMELKGCHTDCNCYPVCWSTGVAVTRLESRECINITTQRLFWWWTLKENSSAGFCIHICMRWEGDRAPKSSS
jgi:hypothetical protein